MRPVDLSSPLLRLDQLRQDDVQQVFEYCQDPVLERYLAALPWPYRLADATAFVTGYVPDAWAGGRECTWAVRPAAGGEFLGVISLSVPPAGRAVGADVAGARRTSSIGFWLGAPHRRRGLIGEAQRLVLDWAFATDLCDAVAWECVAGNLGSARAARTAGFSFSGTGPSGTAYRDGSHPLSWSGLLHATDARTPHAGWPAEVVGG